MKRLTFLSLLLLLLWTPALQAGFVLPAGQRSVRIPVEIQHNVILLPVRINGNMELNFILDTGVRTTILTEPLLVNFLSLDSLASITVRGLGEGEPIEAQMARNVQLDLPGGIKGHNLNLVVLPDGLVSYSGMFGKPVYGIIGYEIFGRFGVEINYQAEYIRLWNPFEMPNYRRWHRLPIQVRKGKPYVKASITTPDGSTQEEDWLIDTGASMALSLFDDNIRPPEPAIDAFLGKGLSGNVFGKMGRLRQFRLGPYKLEEVITGFPAVEALGVDPEKLTWYGNIGAEVISRFRVVFDYPHGQMMFKKTPGYRREFAYNRSGLELISLGTGFNTFVISYVRPDSPADQVGIQVNDEIISLNGFDADEMDIEQIYGRLTGNRAKFLVLKIKRGNKILKKRFKLVSEI